MKVISVTSDINGYIVERDDGIAYWQRKGPKTASQRPLGWDEETFCSLCEKIIELQSELDSSA